MLSRKFQSTIGDIERSNAHSILIDELVREMHNIVVHSVLLSKLYDGFGMRGGEQLEE